MGWDFVPIILLQDLSQIHDIAILMCAVLPLEKSKRYPLWECCIGVNHRFAFVRIMVAGDLRGAGYDLIHWEPVRD